MLRKILVLTLFIQFGDFLPIDNINSFPFGFPTQPPSGPFSPSIPQFTDTNIFQSDQPFLSSSQQQINSFNNNNREQQSQAYNQENHQITEKKTSQITPLFPVGSPTNAHQGHDKNVNINNNNEKLGSDSLLSSNFDRTVNENLPIFRPAQQAPQHDFNQNPEIHYNQPKGDDTFGSGQSTDTLKPNLSSVSSSTDNDKDKIYLPNEREKIEFVYPPPLVFDEDGTTTTRPSLIMYVKNRSKTSTESSIQT